MLGRLLYITITHHIGVIAESVHCHIIAGKKPNAEVMMDPFKILRKNAEVTKQSLYNTIMHCSPNVLQLCPTYSVRT